MEQEAYVDRETVNSHLVSEKTELFLPPPVLPTGVWGPKNLSDPVE